jgi:hypothetical protein
LMCRGVYMKMRGLLCACLCLFAMRCATYYHIFSGEKSTYFTEQETALLEKTTRAIDFDYGYDQGTGLDYVFPVSRGYTDFKEDDRELSRALETVDGKVLIAYYEKIYRLKMLTDMKMEKFREDGNWQSYTFLEKYLRPPLEHYTETLEKQAVRKDRAYSNDVEKRKKVIEDTIRFEKKKLEFEAMWKNDYDS